MWPSNLLWARFDGCRKACSWAMLIQRYNCVDIAIAWYMSTAQSVGDTLYGWAVLVICSNLKLAAPEWRRK